MPEFKNTTKKYGENAVLDNFSLILEKNSTTVIMGESGKGKTTLLRIAAGLEKADIGSFEAEGERLAYMFQEPRLIPQKTAIENIRAVLPRSHFALAEKYLSSVGLDVKTDGKKYPSELSGGMRQRVAFARFLAYAEATRATLLLLDEPFSSLDEGTADKMLALLKEFSSGKTLLVVSHDETDAQALGAQVVKL